MSKLVDQYDIVAALKTDDSAFIAAPTLPTVFTIELTTVCPNFCSGCANVELAREKSGRQYTDAYMKNWKEIIDIIAKETNNKAIIRFSGGEPTLHPQFDEIVRYTDGKGMPHALLTTGRWTKIRLQKIIELYKSCHKMTGMLISLHGVSADEHLEFVESVEKAFDESCRSINEVTQAGIRVFTNTVLMKNNCSKVEEIISLSASLGAEYAVFNRFMGEEDQRQPTDSQLLFAIERIKGLHKKGMKCRIGNSLPKCFSPITSYPTPAGYELCHVAPDGRIRPDNLTNWSFGNLLKDSLRNIWSSTTAQSYRAHIPLTCRHCAALATCRGGAKSLTFGTPLAGDPLMRKPLTYDEDKIITDDDKDNKSLPFLALTSD